MKTIGLTALYLALLLFDAIIVLAQQDPPTKLIQAYWDDDYINFYGKGTDRSYTDGNKLTMFYTQKKPSRFFIDRVLPKSGDSSNLVYGWGLVLLMFTPQQITDPKLQPNDYPWSGALYATHSLYSYNEKKKYDFQTELDLGVTGPASLAGNAQDAFHRMIHYFRPKGWNNQFGNSPWVNVNFTAEKELLHDGKWLEVIGGGQADAGTGVNATAFYSMVRIGKMNPYFQGLIRQYSRSGSGNKVQFYFVARAQVQWLLTSALLQGGPGASRPAPIMITGKNGPSPEYYHPLNSAVANYAYGAVLAINRFSISTLQTTSTPWMKSLYSQTWGNITVNYIL